MRRNFRPISFATLVIALVSIGVYAQQSKQRYVDSPQAASADIPPGPTKQRLLARASDATKEGVASKGVSDEEVGDSDSFGRNVKWLGLAANNVLLSATCPLPGYDPDAKCAEIAPAPATTSFDFDDIDHVTLPGKSANSLLCYWFSPYLSIQYANPTGSAVTAHLDYFPTLTVENPVLDDPALIDASTGLPFNGSLLTGMTSSERFEVPLAPGQNLYSRTRDSTVCIAGFISRKALILNYGLTESQAKEFFKKPTVVRLNIRGTTQYVSDAQLYFGLRIVGD